jgi:hypothetical protein
MTCTDVISGKHRVSVVMFMAGDQAARLVKSEAR